MTKWILFKENGYIWDKVFKNESNKIGGRQPLQKFKGIMVCLSRPYPFKFFEGCLPQIYWVHSWTLCPIYKFWIKKTLNIPSDFINQPTDIVKYLIVGNLHISSHQVTENQAPAEMFDEYLSANNDNNNKGNEFLKTITSVTYQLDWVLWVVQKSTSEWRIWYTISNWWHCFGELFHLVS